MTAPAPPRSPYSLIQEDLWPDEWAILVACQLLNRTTRRQVARVLPELLRRWPDAGSLSRADEDAVSDVVASLGFKSRRVKNLMAMARVFLEGPPSDARALPGCGEYAGRAHDIFCRGVLGTEPPADGALVKYWRWASARATKEASR